jgi:hypothetical protein
MFLIVGTDPKKKKTLRYSAGLLSQLPLSFFLSFRVSVRVRAWTLARHSGFWIDLREALCSGRLVYMCHRLFYSWSQTKDGVRCMNDDCPGRERTTAPAGNGRRPGRRVWRAHARMWSMCEDARKVHTCLTTSCPALDADHACMLLYKFASTVRSIARRIIIIIIIVWYNQFIINFLISNWYFIISNYNSFQFYPKSN